MRLYPQSLEHTSNQIRILILEPAEKPDDPVICGLKYAKLGTGEQFESLSYRWSDAGDTQDVIVDATAIGGSREVIPVAQSLVAALKQLRLKHSPRHLWIDQLCINQADVEERAQQVILMSRLYAEAALVHIWLGEGDATLSAAIRVLRDFYNYNNPICEGGNVCRCEGTSHRISPRRRRQQREKNGFATSDKAGTRIFEIHSKDWDNEVVRSARGLQGRLSLSQLMSCLFSNPWFSRTWVLQEALRARVALVHCGAEIVPWDEVLYINEWLGSKEYASSQLFQGAPGVTMPRVWNLLQKSLKLAEDLPRSGHGDEQMTIIDVFLRGLDLQATDLRDKLFAMLPFGRETCETDKVPPSLQPNYNDDNTLEQVLSSFTRWCIIEYSNLDILSWAHCKRQQTWRRTERDSVKPDLIRPTWALGAEGKYTWGQATLLAENRYSASKNSQPDLDLLKIALNGFDELLQLKLKGFKVSEVSEITFLAFDHVKLEDLSGPGKSLLRAFDRIFDATATFNFWDAWWPEANENRWPNADKVLKRWFERSDGIRDHVTAHTQYTQRHEVEAYDFSALAQEGSLRKVVSQECPSCFDPYFFVASNGMKGLCPWPARKGDMIVLLFGGKVPYLIRPARHGMTKGPGQGELEAYAGEFEFVGECFVMQAMMGDLFQRLLDDGIKPSVFTLV
ncbi:heterokaryon incompatibility protein-domain-containing protein [Xylariomycetidae sp. FL2044]|nr:heterokaryon incompatibility protein-domain-containing protein [Xylariomycetidae sp. FL2044]